MNVSIKGDIDSYPGPAAKRQGGSRDDVIIHINYTRKELFALIRKIRQKKHYPLK